MPFRGPATNDGHGVADYYWQQPGILFHLMGLAQRQALCENVFHSLCRAAIHIQRRHIDNCTKADAVYDAGMARALGLNVSAHAAE